MLQLVIRRGMTVIGLGIVVGLLAALVLTLWISSLLFLVESTDVATFAAVSLLLLTAGAFACLVPGRRAMRLEPAAVLRSE